MNKRHIIDDVYNYNQNQNNLKKQIIELNNNIIINLNNSNKDNNNNNTYNKVFNNIYIKKIIFNHLNKFNILYPIKVGFKSVKEFQQFKYKEYLNRVTLDFKDDQFELNQLPMNIKHITLRKPKKINNEHYEIIQVPDHIESVSYVSKVKANYINSLSKQPHSSKINTLNIHCLEEEILPNQIPNSVTELDIKTIKLSNNILPSNLKKLFVEGLKSFEDNSLQIESLTHIYILYSTPLIIDQLSTPFFKNLVKLEFINENSIIDSNIQFPHNFKQLIIECNSFNYKSQIETNKICPLQFPLSLEKLLILLNNDEDDIYFESLPPNLKSLKFPFSSIIDDRSQSILSSKLKKLVMFGSLKQELQVNQLPSTLTYIDLTVSGFNEKLQTNQLPPTLTYLNLGRIYDQIIDVNVLPTNLNTLVLDELFSQEIH